jgi:hypothetical protein
VKIPPVPEKPRRIITAAQFDRLYQTLPDADTQLLIETEAHVAARTRSTAAAPPPGMTEPDEKGRLGQGHRRPYSSFMGAPICRS